MGLRAHTGSTGPTGSGPYGPPTGPLRAYGLYGPAGPLRESEPSSMKKDGEFIYCFMCARTAWETKHKANKHTCFETEFLTSSFFLRIRKDERDTKEEYATAHRHARQNRKERGHKKASRGWWHPTSEPTQIKAHH